VTIWEQILETLRSEMPDEDFRRWFGATAYASDSGGQVTVWVPTESIRRHINGHYDDAIGRALRALGRPHTHVRLVVSGMDEDEDDEEGPG
jgi:chromosomal replication initiation ATPase DnaA